MIMSVEEFKTFVQTDMADSVLEAKLQALEMLIRKHTNNNFQLRNIRFKCPVMATKLFLTSNLLQEGDTVQISESMYADGVYNITEISDGYIALNKILFDEPEVLVTKIEYPIDVKLGVVNLMKWELENRSKIGIQSETISRHSVTYFDMSADNSLVGYPKALIGFLKPYMKARF